MVKDTYVPEAIRTAEKGSLLYEVVEKIAYRLHEQHLERDADNNWLTGQKYLQNWIQSRFGEFVVPSVSKLVKICLDSGEKSDKEKGIVRPDPKYWLAEIIVGLHEQDKILPIPA